MSSTLLAIVDAFADGPFEGNPAGVCLLPKMQSDLWMQALASELKHSETAFVVPLGKDFQLRWFTPNKEVDLCGHATLASAHVLWDQGKLPKDQEARFHTRSGVLTVRIDRDKLAMDFPASQVIPMAAPALLADALGTSVTECFQSDFDLLAVAESEDQIRSLAPNIALLEKLDCRGVCVTAPANVGQPYDFVSRFFAPRFGIPEDPVTGSAHCALAVFWCGRFGRQTLVGRQISDRGGTVGVQLKGDRVILTGKAIITVTGFLSDAVMNYAESS